MHPDKSGHGTVNAPVVCDGVLVQPGDLIVADGDGVICIPKADAAAVVDGALARMRKEDDLARQIAEGAAAWDLSGAAASYASMAVDEFDRAHDDVAHVARTSPPHSHMKRILLSLALALFFAAPFTRAAKESPALLGRATNRFGLPAKSQSPARLASKSCVVPAFAPQSPFRSG